MSDAFLEKMADGLFGSDGTYSKEYAANQGDALFSAFLAELSAVPDTNPHKATILKRAHARRYHDYEGDLVKIGLVADLSAAGLHELKKRVIQGEFDFCIIS